MATRAPGWLVFAALARSFLHVAGAAAVGVGVGAGVGAGAGVVVGCGEEEEEEEEEEEVVVVVVVTWGFDLHACASENHWQSNASRQGSVLLPVWCLLSV